MKKKKYLKPQVDVAQTGPCMMINPSQVKIYKMGAFRLDRNWWTPNLP